MAATGGDTVPHQRSHTGPESHGRPHTFTPSSSRLVPHLDPVFLHPVYHSPPLCLPPVLSDPALLLSVVGLFPIKGSQWLMACGEFNTEIVVDAAGSGGGSGGIGGGPGLETAGDRLDYWSLLLLVVTHFQVGKRESVWGGEGQGWDRVGFGGVAALIYTPADIKGPCTWLFPNH